MTRLARVIRAGSAAPCRAEPAPDALAAKLLAVLLLAAAITAAAVVAARGGALPPPVPTFVLVVLLAVAVNRGAFFSTELVATAEAAVLFTAVVAFPADARVLGPLLVALAIGVLDSVHWRQRAFVRMAYNSGTQGLAILAGGLTFGPALSWFGSTVPGVVASAAVGAIPYFVVDSACGTALLLALGSEVAPAVRHQWSLNGMALPYACVGAIAGLLATDVGWWAAVAVLAPLPWVPEVLLMRARWLRRAPIRARVSVLAGGVAVGATVVVVTRVGAAGDYAPFVLVALAALLGLELRVSARRAVAPLTALVVVPAALLDGPGAVAVAAAVAAVTVAASWAAAHRTALAPAAVAVLSAALGGAVAGALVWMAFPGTDSTGLVAEGAAAAAAFVAVATVASRDHRATARSAWWCSPILAVGVLAGGWQGHGATAPLFAVITTAGALVATAWCAAPPWPSTLLGPGLDRRGPRRRRRAAVVVATFAFATALLEGVASSRSARLTAVTVAAVLGEVVIGMTIAAVRQWRFAPRARVLDGAILGASALVLLFVYVPLASAGLEIGLPLMCGVLVTALARSWRPLGHADRVPARRDSNNIRATSSADVDAALSRRSLS